MPRDVSAFQLLLAGIWGNLQVEAVCFVYCGFLLAISLCQENSNTTLTSSPSEATSATTISLTTLLSREITTSRPISAEPEFSVGTIISNISESAQSSTRITQLSTVASVTVESITSTPSSTIQSTSGNERADTTERHVDSTSEATTVNTAQVFSAHSTNGTARSTEAPVTTQQGAATCITAIQQETTTQSVPTQVLANYNVTEAAVPPTAQLASALTTLGTSTSAPSGSTSSSETVITQRASTHHTPASLETSPFSSTPSREGELKEHHTSSFQMSTVTPPSSTIAENTRIDDSTTDVIFNSTEIYENGTESSSEMEKEVYMSMYARNITLAIVLMAVLNIMSLSLAIFIFSRIVKRSHRWDRPPSRCGSKRQYYVSNPQPPSASACTLISGRNLANDAECQDGESTRESVPVVTKDSGWCVPLSDDKKKVNQDQRTEEDTGV